MYNAVNMHFFYFFRFQLLCQCKNGRVRIIRVTAVVTEVDITAATPAR